jgi:hypothetical protein
MRLIRPISPAVLCCLKWMMFALWGLAGLCILYDAALWLYFFEVESRLDRVLADASAINGRGDEVTATTKRESAGSSAARTVIRLKVTHHWSATSLLTAESDDYLVGFKWRGDDRLVLTLDFGCNAHMTDPVETVGPIQIVYRKGSPSSFPNHGYSSFPSDVARKPCK